MKEIQRLQLEATLEQCKDAGLRRTNALAMLVETLIISDSPMTLADLSEHKNLTELCDRATVFRLLQKLSEKGVVRRLGLHERGAYFTLLIPGRHQDFLICTDCGDIQPINAPCPVHQLEKEIATIPGYTSL